MKSPQDKTKEKKPRKLTYKQRAFIDEFVLTKNGAQSAVKAYNTNALVGRNIASENMAKPYIKKEIDKRFQAVQEMYQALSQESVTITAEIMRESDNDAVRLSAAKDIQDRAGHQPIAKSVQVTKSLRIDL